MTIRALTVDAVGTLIVPHPSVGAVYATVAARHGLVRDAAELDAAFPAAFRAVQQRWGVPYGADDEDARRFWIEVIHGTFGEPLSYELCMNLYDAFAGPACWRVLPGARELLVLAARHGLPVAVVSNFDGRLPPLLVALGLGPLATVVVSAAVGRAKPDPLPLLTACQRLGAAPAQVLHLGDSAREDGACCAAAGVRWLAVEANAGIDVVALERLL